MYHFTPKKLVKFSKWQNQLFTKSEKILIIISYRHLEVFRGVGRHLEKQPTVFYPWATEPSSQQCSECYYCRTSCLQALVFGRNNQSLIRKDCCSELLSNVAIWRVFFSRLWFWVKSKYETFNSCWSWLVNKGCQNWGTWTERVKLMPRCAKSRTWPTHRRCCCSTACCRCCPCWRRRWWRTLCSGWASPENTHGQHWLQLVAPYLQRCVI